jgi:Rod binding domain-containing protein
MDLSILSREPPLHVLPDPAKAAASPKERLKGVAREFETVYLNTMLSQMFAGLPTDGPFHAGQAEETWRGMLVNEYAKGISQRGGVGVADAVYRELIRMQEGAA